VIHLTRCVYVYIYIYLYIFIYLFIHIHVTQQPYSVPSRLILRFVDHIQRRNTVGRAPLDQWWSQRPLPDNTQHSQQT